MKIVIVFNSGLYNAKVNSNHYGFANELIYDSIYIRQLRTCYEKFPCRPNQPSMIKYNGWSLYFTDDQLQYIKTPNEESLEIIFIGEVRIHRYVHDINLSGLTRRLPSNDIRYFAKHREDVSDIIKSMPGVDYYNLNTQDCLDLKLMHGIEIGVY